MTYKLPIRTNEVIEYSKSFRWRFEGLPVERKKHLPAWMAIRRVKIVAKELYRLAQPGLERIFNVRYVENMVSKTP